MTVLMVYLASKVLKVILVILLITGRLHREKKEKEVIRAIKAYLEDGVSQENLAIQVHMV